MYEIFLSILLTLVNIKGYQFLIKSKNTRRNILARSFYATLENISRRVDKSVIEESICNYNVKQGIEGTWPLGTKILLLFPEKAPFLVGGLTEAEGEHSKIYVQCGPPVGVTFSFFISSLRGHPFILSLIFLACGTTIHTSRRAQGD